MIQVVDVRRQFCSNAVYKIYASCMYQPTWEKFCIKAEKFLRDETVSLLGAVDQDTILGIIVLQAQAVDRVEILGIAVEPGYRRQGIGRQLVLTAEKLCHGARLYAETDEDAVAFYKNCGFYIEPHVETFPDGAVLRYRCIQKQR